MSSCVSSVIPARAGIHASRKVIVILRETSRIGTKASNACPRVRKARTTSTPARRQGLASRVTSRPGAVAQPREAKPIVGSTPSAASSSPPWRILVSVRLTPRQWLRVYRDISSHDGSGEHGDAPPAHSQRGERSGATSTPGGQGAGGTTPRRGSVSAACNARIGLALPCPLTGQVKGYPFGVAIPDGRAVCGAILGGSGEEPGPASAQRGCNRGTPRETVAEVLHKLVCFCPRAEHLEVRIPAT